LIWGIIVNLISWANNFLQPCLLEILEQRLSGTLSPVMLRSGSAGSIWCLEAERRIKSFLKKQAIKVALRKLVTLLSGWVA